MPFKITTKDGITIQNIPDDVDPNSQQLKDKVAEIRVQRQSGAEIQGEIDAPLTQQAEAAAPAPTDPTREQPGITQANPDVIRDEQDVSTLGATAGGLKEGLKRALEGVEQFVREADIRTKELGQTGFLGFDPAVPSGDIGEQADVIADLSENLSEFNSDVRKRRKEFEATPEGQSFAGQAAVMFGETLPFLAVPGGVQGTVLKRVGTGVVSGLGTGAVQFDTGEGREGGTVLGATVGGAFPLAGAGIKEVFTRAAPYFGKVTKNLVIKMGGEKNLRSTVKRLESAKRLGLDITPAEATGDPILAARQGKIGASEGGLEKLSQIGAKRQVQEGAIINKFLGDLSPDGSSASIAIRNNAKRIIKDEEFALAEAARPFYTKANQDILPDEQLKFLMEDPVIAKAYKAVLRTPEFQKDLGDAPLESIKTLDLVKKFLNDESEKQARLGNMNRSRIIGDSTRGLLIVADEVSPDYKTARAIYSNDAPGVKALKEGVVGRISKLDDIQLKNVSTILFDPKQTDISVISKLARRFKDEDPEAWRRIIRNEFDRRLDATIKDRSGSSFFDAILRRPRDFRLFLAATKNIPETRKALIDMQRAFKNLINPITTKTAAGQARSSLDVPRSSLQFAVDKIQKLSGSGLDKASVEVITSPRWHEELSKAMAAKGRGAKTELLADLLGKVVTVQGNELASEGGQVAGQN